MSDSRGGGPAFSLSGAAIILALLGALVVQELPLRGSRPSQPVASGYDIPGREDVPARLWQDPFSAVQRYLQTIGKDAQQWTAEPLPYDLSQLCEKFGPQGSGVIDTGSEGVSLEGVGADRTIPDPTPYFHSHYEVACQIRKSIEESEKPVSVLGVMVFGGPYVEDAEHRTRRRYAVVSALDTAGYTPADSGHISFFHDPVLMGREEAIADSGLVRRFVPYEWYEPKAGHAGNPLLLLWLNDDGYQTDPFRRLGKMLASIFPPCTEFPDAIKIIGPAGSTTLRAMVLELSSGGLPEDGPGAAMLNLVEIYSPSATAADALLLGHAEIGESEGEDLVDLFESNWVRFLRTIPSDLGLSRLLVHELGLRGVTVGDAAAPGKQDHIVLISEWDTLYGRALPDAFQDSIARDCGESGNNEKGCNDWIHWLHRYSYLRGLDGRIPNVKEKDGSSASSGDQFGSVGGGGRVAAPERAEGQKQVDYARRLAGEIERLDDQLQADEKGRIKAIGVLGSDVYDKLLILQAVRPRFSDVIFFTTDLDASLLHPAEYRWTRNMVVASGFGLTLHPARQGHIPPFRDGYQAATFFSVVSALGASPPDQQSIAQCLTPRIFEVGRTGAFDLSQREDDSTACAAGLPKGEAAPLHPPGPDFFPRGRTLFLVLSLVIVGLVLLAAVSDEFREFLAGAWRYSVKHWWIAIPAVVFAIMIPVAAFRLIRADDRYGEPFSFTEGISIWPTELLRGVAAMLAIYFLARCWREIKKSNKRIRDKKGDFRLYPDTVAGEKPAGFLERFLPFSVYRWRRKGREAHCVAGEPVSVSHSSSKNADERHKAGCEWLDIRKIWAENQFLGTFWRRISRSTIRVAIYVLLAILLMQLFGRPFLPYRGDAAFSIDRMVLIVSVLSMMLLIFFVVDATRLCRVFIEKLVDGRVAWPANTVESCCGQFGVHPGFAMEVLNIKLIASRTDTISRLIYYPFLVLFLMILSRITYFDDWDLPLGLAIIFLLNALYLVYCAIAMRRTAVTARDSAIDRLEKEHMKVTKMGGKESPLSTQVELVIEYLRDIHSGAFVPIHQQPLVRSLLLPFGALGLSVLDYLSLAS